MGSRALIMQDGFKLVESNRKQDNFQLYNILQDNQERTDLAAEYPDKVELLIEIMQQETNSARPDLQP